MPTDTRRLIRTALQAARDRASPEAALIVDGQQRYGLAELQRLQAAGRLAETLQEITPAAEELLDEAERQRRTGQPTLVIRHPWNVDIDRVDYRAPAGVQLIVMDMRIPDNDLSDILI